LLWQWNHAEKGVITATGLDVHRDLLKYLIHKEAGKMFAEADEGTRQRSANAQQQLLELVTGDALPLEPMV
jgi:hypothetical protein